MDRATDKTYWDMPAAKVHWDTLDLWEKKVVIGKEVFGYRASSAYGDPKWHDDTMCWLIEDSAGNPLRDYIPFQSEARAWGTMVPNYAEDRCDAFAVLDAVREQLFSVRYHFWQSVQQQVSADTLRETGRLLAWPDAFWQMTPDIICYAALVALERGRGDTPAT